MKKATTANYFVIWSRWHVCKSFVFYVKAWTVWTFRLQYWETFWRPNCDVCFLVFVFPPHNKGQHYISSGLKCTCPSCWRHQCKRVSTYDWASWASRWGDWSRAWNSVRRSHYPRCSDCSLCSDVPLCHSPSPEITSKYTLVIEYLR